MSLLNQVFNCESLMVLSIVKFWRLTETLWLPEEDYMITGGQGFRPSQAVMKVVWEK